MEVRGVPGPRHEWREYNSSCSCGQNDPSDSDGLDSYKGGKYRDGREEGGREGRSRGRRTGEVPDQTLRPQENVEGRDTQEEGSLETREGTGDVEVPHRVDGCRGREFNDCQKPCFTR